MLAWSFLRPHSCRRLEEEAEAERKAQEEASYRWLLAHRVQSTTTDTEDSRTISRMDVGVYLKGFYRGSRVPSTKP